MDVDGEIGSKAVPEGIIIHIVPLHPARAALKPQI